MDLRVRTPEDAGQLGGAREPMHPGALGILIDFDNLAPPTSEINESSVRHALLRCIRLAMEFHGEPETVRVRLYGGWMTDGLLSRRGSEVAAAMRTLDPFPVLLEGNSIVRGSLELATSLLDDKEVFEDTFRRRGSIPRVRLKGSPVPEGCAGETDTCPARILKQFTQSANRNCPTSTCTLTASTAFVANEQKMVDTLISCDLLEMAFDSSYRGVTVVSADTDFVPPLLHAARRGSGTLQLIAPMEQWSPASRTSLESRGINVIEMEP